MYSENILILTPWSYKDALIQTYTYPYVRLIRKNLAPSRKIFLRTLEQERLQLRPEEARLEKDKLLSEGVEWIPHAYCKPGVKAALDFITQLFFLLKLIRRNNVKIIHIWCTPPSVLAYVLSIFTGARIVIDSYEPHAEAMVENGSWKSSSLKFRILFLFEKLVSRKAVAIISATRGMKDYAQKKYGATLPVFFVKPACVNLELFSFKDKKNSALLKSYHLENKIVCVYAGKFGGIYLGREVFDFFKVAEDYWGDRFRVLLLTSHTTEEIDAFCKEAKVTRTIVRQKFVAHSEVPVYLGLGDFAITPVKPVKTKRYCTPIKDGEYWALGLPVIIPENISDDSAIIENHKTGVVLKSLSIPEYERAVKEMDVLLKSASPEDLYNKIRKTAEEFRSFRIAEDIYRQLYH